MRAGLYPAMWAAIQAAVGHQDPRTTLLYQDGRDALDQSPVYTVAGRLAAAQHRLT